MVAGVVGLGLALVTGWLGGELVERLGVGVSDGAHLDAPSSLSQLPASLNRRAATAGWGGGPDRAPARGLGWSGAPRTRRAVKQVRAGRAPARPPDGMIC